MPTWTDIHLFQPANMKNARTTIGRAFLEDPMMRFIIPDQKKRHRSTGWYLGKAVWFGYLYGKVFVPSDKVEGVAVWLPPGIDLTLRRLIRPDFIDLLSIPPRFGGRGVRNLARLESRSMKMHEASVHGRPHWYLFVIGVDPEYQRQGLGAALLQPMLAQADKDHILCYLKTENENNLKFYRQLGFEVSCTETVPGGPTMWAMIREPA